LIPIIDQDGPMSTVCLVYNSNSSLVLHSLRHNFNLFRIYFLVQDLLRATDDHDVGPAVAHFLNCIMGNVQPTSTKGGSVQSKLHKMVMCII
jgi:hypothetical protein